MTAVRFVAIAPDPLAIARALRDRPGLAVLASSCDRYAFVASDPVAVSQDLAPPPSSDPAPGYGGASSPPEWIGVVPYEAMRSIERAAWTRAPDARATPFFTAPRWQRYAAVARIDRATGAVSLEGESGAAIDALALRLRAASFAEAPRAFRLRPSGDDEDPSAHAARVREVLELIARGDVYQVNLARRLTFEFRGDALEVFARSFIAARPSMAFYASLGEITVAGASPELALEARDGWLRTSPIKGTLPRGADAPEDRARASRLDADPKERAELTMAIDLHRNDLGRVAVPGSVRVLGEPWVVAGPSVFSRVAQVIARRAPGVDNDALLRAVLPCGSVTGAPKIRAMEIIAQLEPHRRGLYTGVCGAIARDGSMTLAMAIRTLEIRGERAHYFSGGGIVAGSDPARELEETRWKARHLPLS